MSRQSGQSRSPGWIITAQSVSMAASLVAIAVVLLKPISYVADLRIAVDRLAETTARIDTATRLQDDRTRQLEARVNRLLELGGAALSVDGSPPRGPAQPSCPGAESSR